MLEEFFGCYKNFYDVRRIFWMLEEFFWLEKFFGCFCDMRNYLSRDEGKADNIYLDLKNCFIIHLKEKNKRSKHTKSTSGVCMSW